MDIYSRVKNFFGFSNENAFANRDENTRRTIIPNDEEKTRESPVDDFSRDEYDKLGFDMFAHTIKIHKYLEQQMSEIMKNFGMHGHGSFFRGGDELYFGNGGPSGDLFFGENPLVDDFLQLPGSDDYSKEKDFQESNLRDKYLKSGYEIPNSSEESRADKDVDGKFNIGDLDSVLSGRNSSPKKVVPKSFFYSKSMVTKTIRKPDGTYETHKTIRDHDGNEETTITRSQGDKTYSIITKIDKEGHKEILENMINMDENDSFAKDGTIVERNYDSPSANWFPFDKFFRH